MEIHINNETLQMHVPSEAKSVRAFINGTPVSKRINVDNSTEQSSSRAEGVTLEIGIGEIANTAMCASLPFPSNEGVLLQVYAFDSAGQPIASASIPTMQLPRCRGAPMMSVPSAATAEQNRLVATAMHNPGDMHVWEFPIRRLGVDFNPNKQTAIFAVYLRAIFEADPVLLCSGVGIGAISWSHTPPTALHFVGAQPPKRQKMPPPIAWGEHRAITHIDKDCMESVFMVTLPVTSLDGMIRCEVTTALDAYIILGGLRYAIYGRIVEFMGNAPTLGVVACPQLDEPPPVVETMVTEKGKRVAVLVGVSKYTRRRNSDLEWADDDAVTWYEYLSARGYGSLPLSHKKERDSDTNAGCLVTSSPRTCIGDGTTSGDRMRASVSRARVCGGQVLGVIL
jgi:hypothetical protein